MNAIRTRILLPTLALVLLGSLGVVLLSVRDNHREIESVYDAQLVQAARVMQGLLRQLPADKDWQAVRQALEQALKPSADGIVSHPYEMNLAFKVWDSDKRLLMRSADAPALDGPPALGIHDITYNGEHWCGVLLEDRHSAVLIWVGERDDLREDLIQRIVNQTLLPALIGVPLLALMIWLLLGWGLRPLRRLTSRVNERPIDSLEPLCADGLPLELAPMANALNHQLLHLKRLLESERRFIADAAHELRTPLAVLAIHANNAREAVSEGERNDALAFLEQGVARASRLAGQLLTMARLEPLRQVRQCLQLDTLVRQELAVLAPLAFRRQVELVLQVQAPCHLHADPAAITVMMQNLVTNALQFSPPGSEITLSLEVRGEYLVIEVLDQGPGVAPHRLARLSDRFYSVNNAGGAGLGLAIVSVVVEQLGGVLRLFNRAEGGFGVEVKVPGRSGQL